MQEFIEQLKERRIWRVLVVYPSLAFVLLQAVEFFINNYDLDPRYLTAGIIISIVLLPAAVLWNWRHGEVGEQAFSFGEVGFYGISLLASVAAAAWFWSVTPAVLRDHTPPELAVRTIAVMPFENVDGDASVQYLCDGIAESLINWLATIDGIKVVSKSASFRMRDDSMDTERLAEALGVNSVLRGRLEQVGEQLMISASLVDTRDESQLWGERLARPSDEVLQLEQSIVAAMSDSLRLEVADNSKAASAGITTDQPEAYQHYLRGHYLIQATDPESIELGIEELRTAIKLDPGYARPYADIADAYSQLLSYGYYHGDVLIGEARTAAYTAVALAPDLAESHTALATILQYYEFDWPAVDQAYEAAVALNPKSPVPYHRYADYLVITLRFERAREMSLLAIEIDPLDGSSLHSRGFTELFAGDFPAAVQAMSDWNRFHPESLWSYTKYAVALSLNGQCEQALEKANEVMRKSDGEISLLMESWLGWSYKVCGFEERYQFSKNRIYATLESDPDALATEPGMAYILAIEGDDEALVKQLAEFVKNGHPMTVFGRIFLIDYLGWGTSDTMPHNQRYLDLLEQIDFPPREP